LLLTLTDQSKKKKKNSLNSFHILFNFGMTGRWISFNSIEDIPKHAHFIVYGKNKDNGVCYVDQRRFGKWREATSFSSDRGPDPTSEFEDFCHNVQTKLDSNVFNKPICEVLLDQSYFNGIGNYLRAEILYRIDIPPFTLAREVLQGKKARQLLQACHDIPMEVKQLFQLDDGSARAAASFNAWLQVYGQPSGACVLDGNKRTIWFDPKYMKDCKGKTRLSNPKFMQEEANYYSIPTVEDAVESKTGIKKEKKSRRKMTENKADASPHEIIVKEELDGVTSPVVEVGKKKARRKRTAEAVVKLEDVPAAATSKSKRRRSPRDTVDR